MLNIRSLTAFTFLPLTLLFLQSCGDDPMGIDYSQVPDPFVDIHQQQADSTTDDGLQIYFVEPGNEMLPAVTSNDQIRLRYTGRTADGEIFESTWVNGFDRPAVFRNLTPEPINTGAGRAGPLIDGFRRGLIGMHEGEKRTLVIPPELGYIDNEDHSLHNKILVFDIELLQIL